MQETLEREQTSLSLLLEIRSSATSHPAGASFLPESATPRECSRLVLATSPNRDLGPNDFTVLIDPLRERVSADPCFDAEPYLDIFYRPGVTDEEGDVACKAMALAGRDVVCRSGLRYRFPFRIPPSKRHQVEDALGNPLIHEFKWSDDEPSADWRSTSEAPFADHPCFAHFIELTSATDESLEGISRQLGLALDLHEMRAISEYFRSAGRQPTNVELQSVALTWSEHCSHKTFKAPIRHRNDSGTHVIDGLLSTCIAKPSLELDKEWMRSAFIDNAGVIAFDATHDVAVKVETHNHPSALEPYGGAHTGIGGVIRDVLAVSAEPFANTDVLCFGPPDLEATELNSVSRHPLQTLRGVVSGIADYGNNMGIPTIGGAVLFDRGYIANPLVFCGTLGLLPNGSHPTMPSPGDAIVLIGGRTGRDGLQGATMSSASLNMVGTDQRSTVQIGAPIVEKVVRDVLPLLRDERLYTGITDCGAGGLCSAVGEMGAELGFECDLDQIPLKYEGLEAWEIWLSEAQERMVLAMPPENLPRAQALCEQLDVEMTIIGFFTDSGQMRLRHRREMVADLSLQFMHSGSPRRLRESCFLQTRESETPAASDQPEIVSSPDFETVLLALLAHPNIASKEEIIRRFDHEVGGGTVGKPLTERGGPADGAVLRPVAGSNRGVVIAHGINPRYGEITPRQMVVLAVDEALRNLVAVGGSIDRAALLDNFCWGEMDSEEGLGALVEAALGCRDAIELYEVPFICGKDSLRNCSTGERGTTSVPGTVLITAVGIVDDVARRVTMDLKATGSVIYLLGATHSELAGSHLWEVTPKASPSTGEGALPSVPANAPELMRRLTKAIQMGLVLSCHDLSEGGLGVAAAEMAIAGRCGLDLCIDGVAHASTELRISALEAIFSESGARFLCEVNPADADDFERLMNDLPAVAVGETTSDTTLKVTLDGETILDISVADLERAWRTPLDPPGATSVGTEAATSFTPAAPSRGSTKPTGTALVRPRVAVLTAPGINCDSETMSACSLAHSDPESIPVKTLIAGHRRLSEFSALIIPGGFSYGDHLGAGAFLAALLRAHLIHDLGEFVNLGKPVLGICNGFQVLARLGLLGPISLAPNVHGKFECRWVRLTASLSTCPYFAGLQAFELPIAHGEGQLMPAEGAEDDVLSRSPLHYVENPNGSFGNIAAVSSDSGTVLGLMPHPERFTDPQQHPGGSTRCGQDTPAGLQVFENMVHWAARL